MLRTFFSVLFASFLSLSPAWGWWEDGHRSTARLAAFYLTPATRTRLAAILGVADTPEAVADGLALGSTWPDEIKKARPETQSWHFIDLALQDRKNQIAARCPDQNCVTARIDEFWAQLVKDKSSPDPKTDLDALRFLVHFVGDVHQPLHASSDADLGGNCEPLAPAYEQAKNLHALWDGPLVNDLNADDRLLAADMKRELDRLGNSRLTKMAQGKAEDWAWESHLLAIKVVYNRLKIPLEPVIFPPGCAVAPEAIQQDKITVEPEYFNQMKSVVRLQLERAGLRLAKLLNNAG
jgi:hypothetical protein